MIVGELERMMPGIEAKDVGKTSLLTPVGVFMMSTMSYSSAWLDYQCFLS